MVATASVWLPGSLVRCLVAALTLPLAGLLGWALCFAFHTAVPVGGPA
jgi:hypothetical protein